MKKGGAERGGWGILVRSMLRSVCLGIAVSVSLTAAAWADFVSGRVLGPDGNPVAGKTFTAVLKGKPAVSFSTDKGGNFSVYLDPGTYTVTNDDKTLVGTVHGYPQSTTEDIHMTPPAPNKK